jgi:biotin carboxyl carrier protein
MRPGADLLAAPMPGVVLEVFVSAGAQLHRGDPVLVLEAMKMRNTIRSPRDAVVAEVAVAAGQPVGTGDPLVRLREPEA